MFNPKVQLHSNHLCLQCLRQVLTSVMMRPVMLICGVHYMSAAAFIRFKWNSLYFCVFNQNIIHPHLKLISPPSSCWFALFQKLHSQIFVEGFLIWAMMLPNSARCSLSWPGAYYTELWVICNFGSCFLNVRICCFSLSFMVVNVEFANVAFGLWALW